jgi:rhamnose transport system permease protein
VSGAQTQATSATAARAPRRLSELARWEALIFVLVVGTLVLGSSLSDVFLTADNFSFASSDVAEIALMALPLTLIVVTAEIDLSVASVLGLSSALVGELWMAGWAMEAIIPFCLLVGAACGAFNAVLVTRVGLPSLAVTIGTLTMYRGLALVVLGDTAVADLPPKWTKYGFENLPGTAIPYPIVLFGLLAIAFGVLLHATRLGREIYAIGANQEAAFFSGVRVKRIKALLFVLSGMVAALAGVIMSLRLASARADYGVGLELSVVAAVVLGGVSIFGGKGTIPGVILALVLLGGIRSALTLGDVSQEWVTIVTGALLIGAVLGPNLAGRVREARTHRRDREGWSTRSDTGQPRPPEEREAR